MKKILFITASVCFMCFMLAGCDPNVGDKDMPEITNPIDNMTPNVSESPRTEPDTSLFPSISPNVSESPGTPGESLLPSVTPNVTGSKTSLEDIKNIDMSKTVEHDVFLENTNLKGLNGEKIKDVIKEKAKSKSYKVYDSSVRNNTNSGKTVDIDLTLRNIYEAKAGSHVQFVFKNEGKPSINPENLGLAAEFTTPLLNKNQNARYNMKMASEKINNCILMPGEEFDFFWCVGEVSEKTGYKKAKVFIKQDNGEVKEEEDFGGGICQVSTTLYNVCLKLKLDVTERHEHSKDVSYIEDGKDAAVSYGSLNFKFKNNKSSPILLKAWLDDKSQYVQVFKINI